MTSSTANVKLQNHTFHTYVWIVLFPIDQHVGISGQDVTAEIQRDQPLVKVVVHCTLGRLFVPADVKLYNDGTWRLKKMWRITTKGAIY